MPTAIREFEGTRITMHFWYSGKQAARWSRLPVARIYGVERLYTACESTKEEGATEPKDYAFDDWVYLGEGTILHGGTWHSAKSMSKVASNEAV